MKRLLIVEDNADMQRFYRHMLRGASGEYEIEIEADPLRAIERLKGKRYDLLISDVVMEGMDGERFLRKVRGREKSTRLPLLVVSVLKPDMLVHLKDMEGVRFLEKPITREILLGAIKSMLDSRDDAE